MQFLPFKGPNWYFCKDKGKHVIFGVKYFQNMEFETLWNQDESSRQFSEPNELKREFYEKWPKYPRTISERISRNFIFPKSPKFSKYWKIEFSMKI